MLTTVYLILSVCNGHSCDFKGLEEFTGSKENAVQVCQIARQDYPPVMTYNVTLRQKMKMVSISIV